MPINLISDPKSISSSSSELSVEATRDSLINFSKEIRLILYSISKISIEEIRLFK